jgi:hypothetical protein
VTPGQAALLLLEQTAPESAVYVIATGLHVRGPLALARVQDAYAQVVRRHEALRTTFALGDRGFEARLVADPPCVVATHEARSLDDARALARELAARPIDPAQAPLLALDAIRVGAHEHLLCVTVHHAACDGWSLRIVLRDLAEAYDGRALEEAPAHEQFRSFAADEAAFLASPEGGAELDAWREALAAAPAPLELPRTAAASAGARFAGATVPLALELGAGSELRAICARQGATPFIALLTALTAALQRCSGRQDLVVGAPVANRADPRHAAIVGYLSTTLPIRIDASGDPPLRELLARVRAATLAAFDRERTPFPVLARALGARGAGGRQPLLQVACAVVDLTPTPLPGLEVAAVPLHTGTAKFDLTLYLERHDERLLGHVEHAPAALDGAGAARLAQQLRAALRQLAADPERRLSQLQGAA